MLCGADGVWQDKDTGKYNQGLAQVLDGIRARIAYIEVSGGDMHSARG